MARVSLKFTDNGLGLWKTPDGRWGIRDKGEGYEYRWTLQRNPTGDPWDWEIVGHYRDFGEAALAAREWDNRRSGYAE